MVTVFTFSWRCPLQAGTEDTRSSQLTPAEQQPFDQWRGNDEHFFQATWFSGVKLDAAPEYFYWQEEHNGRKLLHESGFRFGLELSYKEPKDRGWLWAARGKVYFGAVDYDGQTWGGTPLKMTTDYYGGLLELRYGHRWGWGEKQYLDLMGGAGVEGWERSGNGGAPPGYSEYWIPIYLKAGLDLAPKETGWVGALGLKLPVYTTQVADLEKFGLGTATLHPGPMVSGYAEAGYKFTKHFSLTTFFDSYWFKQSSAASSNNGTVIVFQPESKSFEAGAKVGWTF